MEPTLLHSALTIRALINLLSGFHRSKIKHQEKKAPGTHYNTGTKINGGLVLQGDILTAGHSISTILFVPQLLQQAMTWGELGKGSLPKVKQSIPHQSIRAGVCDVAQICASASRCCCLSGHSPCLFLTFSVFLTQQIFKYICKVEKLQQERLWYKHIYHRIP